MKNAKQPPHRPSRRDEIVAAAVKVFAEKGYADAAIGDIAEVADVAVTAVYYHFSGKDDLFAAAVKDALDTMSEVVVSARPSSEASRAVGAATAGLRAAIDAVWEWVDQHPEKATLVHVQLPGATPQLSTIRQEFLDRHEVRAADYLSDADDDARSQAVRTAAGILMNRTLIDALMAVHAMRLGDGPLSHLPPAALRTEVHQLAGRMLLQA